MSLNVIYLDNTNILEQVYSITEHYTQSTNFSQAFMLTCIVQPLHVLLENILS